MHGRRGHGGFTECLTRCAKQYPEGRGCQTAKHHLGRPGCRRRRGHPALALTPGKVGVDGPAQGIYPAAGLEVRLQGER